MDKFPHKLIGGGAVLLALTAAFGWGGFAMIIRGQLKQNAKLYNKTETWSTWKDSPAPYHLKFYLFHIENPEEMAKGQKPKLKERGPYVYLEKRWKDDITYDKGNDTISYKQLKMYEFLKDMSEGNTEEDMITILNAPLVGVSRIAQESSDKNKILGIVSSKLSQKAERLVVTHPVKELLFDGYGVKPYEELGIEHNGAMSESGGDFMVPEFLMDGKYGLYENKNFTDDGYWEIWSGRTNVSAFKLIKTWNGLDMLPYWTKGEPCYFINGTDGSLTFAPPLKKSSVLRVYEVEHCRSMKYVYEMDTEVKDLKTYRFKLKKEHFMSPENNPENACYCSHEDLSKCGKNGIENLAPCMEGMPMFISKPHFLDADSEIMDAVEGLSPDPEKHDTYLDIHPISGHIMEGKKRWQISIEVTPVPEISMLSSAPKAYVPLYWVEESSMAVDSKFSLMRFLATLQKGCDTIRWGFLVVAASIIVVGIVVALTRRGSSKVDRITLLQ